MEYLSISYRTVQLGVYNRTKDKAEPLIKAGAVYFEKPNLAFKHAPIVFSMVANDDALIDITEGRDGLLESIHEGCVHISLSTVSPDTIKRLAGKHQQKQAQLISATVFGRPDVAARQQLWICVAGETNAKQQAEPFLKMLGKKIDDFGHKPEIANVIKVTGNFMIASVIEILGEAMALVVKNEVKPEQFLSFMTETLFPSPVFQNYGRLIAEQAFVPAGFKMDLGLKDINLFIAAFEKLSLDLPFAKVLQERFLKSIQQGRHEMDWSAISLLSQDAHS